MKLHSAVILVLATAALGVVACSDDDPAPARPDDDASTPVDDSGAEPDTSAPVDASAPDANIVVPPLPIQCSVQPCALELAIAGPSSCARFSDKTVRCWGIDDSGQLGRGPIEAGWDNLPAPVADLAGVVQLSAGRNGYCATLEDGTVKCWGSDDSGQIGLDPDSGASFANVPHTIANLPPARAAFMGDGIACAALVAGDVMCWGNNSNGRFPEGSDAASQLPPTKIDLGGHVFKAIAPGSRAIVALAEDGTLVSWGKRSTPRSGEVTTLGREASLDPSPPSPIAEPRSAALLSGWGDAASAASNGGALRWGLVNGNLGPVTPSPVTFTTSAKVRDISLGEGGQFCAVMDDKSARCMGDNTYGQLGTGDFVNSKLLPVVVKGLSATPARVATAYDHACAILENGVVMCWGLNSRGQLGTGDFAIHLSPTSVRFTP